ncbi:MAG: YicC/YloC family endoribonuclease [Clostridia bacterium]|nr:YicC/YloC family endoribonuclease [Clostridia bacterium]
MIKSMTGYGTACAQVGGKVFTVEIKSVNHRYSDITVKLPRAYNFLEDALRKKALERINRGKADIYVNLEYGDAALGEVKANTALAKSYLDALKTLSQELGVPSNIRAEEFLRIQDVFTVEKAEDDEEEIKEAVIGALNEALDGFDEMRRIEGKKLYDDLYEHLTFIQKAAEEIEKRSPQIVKEYRAKIEERMKAILGDAAYDETRLLTEVAIFSDRINTNEEIVRLKSHTSQFSEMLSSDVPVGRKIDFLIQEMNREINTIGSKSNDLEIAKIVIDVKAEIEKLREQIQNVE